MGRPLLKQAASDRHMATLNQAALRSSHRLALAISAATFLLLILGGIVWSTGSALACPDWPLCYGQVFPKMEGGILFEHGHRLLAGTVLILTVALAVKLWPDPRLRTPGIVAVALVVFQALLGGLTVILQLPLLVRVAHLAMSQAFFATVLYLAYRTREREGLAQQPISIGARGWLLVAAVAVYCQLLLGALVRHTSSGMACDDSALLCKGRAWPDFGPGQVQMLHRYLAMVVLGLVIFATVKALPELRRSGRGFGRFLAIAAHPLVGLQIVLGVGSVLSFLEVGAVTSHLAVGALLWADLFLLYMASGEGLALHEATEAAATTGVPPSLAATAGGG
jgi:heme A synthase